MLFYSLDHIILNFQFRELISRFLPYPDKIGIYPNSRKARKTDTIFGEGSNVKALDQVFLGTPVTWTSVPCRVLKLSDTVCNNLSLIWDLKYGTNQQADYFMYQQFC